MEGTEIRQSEMQYHASDACCFALSLERYARPPPPAMAQRVSQVAHRNVFREKSRESPDEGSPALFMAAEMGAVTLPAVDGRDGKLEETFFTGL